jgi:NAD(P)-dependent dehydrogenase (short-subunit alcohol dehydrogenase family)
MAYYALSKSALTMLTLQYARAFAADPRLRHIKVNAATPGYTKTDLTAGKCTRTVTQGARAIVMTATPGDDGPGGGVRQRHQRRAVAANLRPGRGNAMTRRVAVTPNRICGTIPWHCRRGLR